MSEPTLQEAIRHMVAGASPARPERLTYVYTDDLREVERALVRQQCGLCGAFLANPKKVRSCGKCHVEFAADTEPASHIDETIHGGTWRDDPSLFPADTEPER